MVDLPRVPPQPTIYPNRETVYHHLFKKGGVGAELGVCRGENACHALVGANPSKMYLVDTWDNEEALGLSGAPGSKAIPGIVYDRFEEHFDLIGRDYHRYVCDYFSDQIEKGVVEVYKQRAVIFLNNLDDNYLDWAFIDTSHYYEETFNTLEATIRKTKIGGIIGMHDFFINMGAWDTISPVMHFVFEGKIKLVAQSGPPNCPSVFLQKVV
jgi:hypothetical protein